jgi:hypothetical protein
MQREGKTNNSIEKLSKTTSSPVIKFSINSAQTCGHQVPLICQQPFTSVVFLPETHDLSQTIKKKKSAGKYQLRDI